MFTHKMLEAALGAISKNPREQMWSAFLPKVDPGVDLLVFMALLKQSYADLVAEFDGVPHIVIMGRYVDAAFTHSATRVVLIQIAKTLGAETSSPQGLAKLISAESLRTHVEFEVLVGEYAQKCMKKCVREINILYQIFISLKPLIRWPDLTIMLDLPIKDIKVREVRREQRVYNNGDILYSSITAELYKFLVIRELGRIDLIDATRSREDIAAEVQSLILRKFNLGDYRRRKIRKR